MADKLEQTNQQNSKSRTIEARVSHVAVRSPKEGMFIAGPDFGTATGYYATGEEITYLNTGKKDDNLKKVKKDFGGSSQMAKPSRSSSPP